MVEFERKINFLFVVNVKGVSFTEPLLLPVLDCVEKQGNLVLIAPIQSLRTCLCRTQNSKKIMNPCEKQRLVVG